MTHAQEQRWGNKPDSKVSLLLKKLLVDNIHEPVEQIRSTFEQLSGHRVEARLIPVQSCAFDLRFCASSLFKETPLRDFEHYEKIGVKEIEVGLVAMQSDGAVLLTLGLGAAALLWNEGGRWVTITDDALDGEPVQR